MERHSFPSMAITKKLFLLISPALLILTCPIGTYAGSEMVNVSQTPEERELFNTLPGESQKGGILDATNPMELMNRLKRATAMDDATPPSESIDDALRVFEIESLNRKE